MSALVVATFAEVAALVGLLAENHVASARVGARLLTALHVSVLAHAGEARIVGDDAHEDFLALIGAVLVISSQSDEEGVGGEDQRQQRQDRRHQRCHFLHFFWRWVRPDMQIYANKEERRRAIKGRNNHVTMSTGILLVNT